jgi:hypothetical protein
MHMAVAALSTSTETLLYLSQLEAVVQHYAHLAEKTAWPSRLAEEVLGRHLQDQLFNEALEDMASVLGTMSSAPAWEGFHKRFRTLLERTLGRGDAIRMKR